MRKIMMSLAAIVVAFAAGTMSAPAADARKSAGEAFWRCATGFAFEVSGSAVHCKKPTYVLRKPLGKCPIGLYAYTDRIGDKDTCSATNAITGELGVEHGCATTDIALGYTKRIVHGTDYCEKSMPAEIVAPSVAILL